MSSPELLAATPEGLDAAASLLMAGELVAFPTDTVHGIGVRRDDPPALERLFALKGRPSERRVAWLVAGLSQARELGLSVDGRAERLAQRFWPGGLTLGMSAPDGSTLGVRAPAHPTAQGLLARTGPLPTSSANRHGEPETLGPDEVLVAFATSDGLAAIVDGRSPGGTASSVVDLTQDPARLLREGAVPRSAIEVTVPLAR